MNAPITINENLDISVGRHVVAHLRADEALDLAARLARSAFRRIAFEEGAASLLDGTDNTRANAQTRDA